MASLVRQILLRRLGVTSWLILSLLSLSLMLFSCTAAETGNAELTRQTYLQLVDWHMSGAWIFGSPVAWVRVTNYSPVAIKDVQFKYITYDYQSRKLNDGIYTLEGTIQPGQSKNFIEQYLNVVDIHSEQLSIHLQSVSQAE